MCRVHLLTNKQSIFNKSQSKAQDRMRSKDNTKLHNSKGVYNTGTKQLMQHSKKYIRNASVNEMNQQHSTVQWEFSASAQSGHDNGTDGIGNVITRHNALVDLAMEQTIDIVWIDEFLRNSNFKQSIKGVTVISHL